MVSATALRDAEQGRHGRVTLGSRRLVVGLLGVLVAAALAGLLGQTATTRSATEDGWTVRVTSSAVARAGLDVPLRIEVTRADGFDGPVELALDADYLTMMESQGTFPEPTSARRSGRMLLLELEPPPGGGPLVVDLDSTSSPTRSGVGAGWWRCTTAAGSWPPCRCARGCCREEPVMEVVLRAAVVFVFLWLVTRSVGRATLGELSTFELLLYVTMGDLVQQAVTQQDYSVTGAVLAVGTFVLLTVALSWAQWRWPWLRPLVRGRPVVVVRDGALQRAAMRRQRLAEADLEVAMRGQGIRTSDDVELAVLEPDGRISFFTARGSGDGAREKPPQA